MENNFKSNTIFKKIKVVTDANITTSQGPATAFEFALKIVELLSNIETAKKIKKQLLMA